MAFTAPSALATHPDFPHGDTNPANWVAAEIRGETDGRCEGSYGEEPGVYDTCTLEGEENTLYWSRPEIASGQCDTAFEGEVFGEGIAVTEATVWSSSSYSNLCGPNGEVDFVEQIALPCIYKPTGEVHAGVYTVLDHYIYGHMAGWSYGKIDDSADRLTFSGEWSGSNGFHMSGGYAIAQDVTLVEDVNKNPCAWEELS
jgi:hypothetical protein